MKFGVSVLGLAQQPRGEDMGARLEDLITWVRAARDEGYDHLTTGQHYMSAPFQQFQPLPLMARLVPETGDMRLVSTLIAPLHNPVELAESWGGLDAMSGGRITLCFALGYRDEEYAAFGVAPGTRVERLRQVVDTLRALWTQERVTASGHAFELRDATVTMRPVQWPHPPVWIAANADAAILRAARWGLPWNINAHARFDTVARQVGLYRDAAAAAGHPEPTFPMARELFCAPTRAEAVEAAHTFLAQKYSAYGGWGQARALPGEEDFGEPFDELARDRFVIGDPDDCAREIARYAAIGVDRLHLRMNWPGMPVGDALGGLRLFAADVAPRFRTG